VTSRERQPVPPVAITGVDLGVRKRPQQRERIASLLRHDLVRDRRVAGPREAARRSLAGLVVARPAVAHRDTAQWIDFGA